MPVRNPSEIHFGLEEYSRDERAHEESVAFLKDVLLQRYGPDYASEIFDYVGSPAAGDDFAEGVIMEVYRTVRIWNPGDYDKSTFMQDLEKREILEHVNFYFVSRILELSGEEREKQDPEVLVHADEKVRLYREKIAKSLENFLGGKVERLDELALSGKLAHSKHPDSGFEASIEHSSDFEDVGSGSERCAFWGTISAFEENTSSDTYFSYLRLERDMILGGNVTTGEKPVPYKVRIIVDARQDNNSFGGHEKSLSVGFDVEGDRRLDYSLTFDRSGDLIKVEVPFEIASELGIQKWSRGLWFADPSRIVDFPKLDEEKKVSLMLHISDNLGNMGINVDAFLQGAKGKWADVFNSLTTLDEADAMLKRPEVKSTKAASLVLKPQFLD